MPTSCATRVTPRILRAQLEPAPPSRGTGAAHGLEHPLVGLDPAEQAPDQTLGIRHADALAEAGLEVLDGDVAALELAQEPERVRVLPERPLHGLRIEPLLFPERPERVEDVGRQDPAEVHEQA